MLSPNNDILVALNDISLSYGNTAVLHHIDLRVSKNDFVVIRGTNGCGKTSLLRVLLKLIKPTSGSVTYYQQNTGNQAFTIGYLSQKNVIDNRFPISVEEVIASGLYPNSKKKTPPELLKTRIEETLAELDLTHLAQRPIGELSGGQLQRTLLGRAIISQPQLLVLDEPLSYIDDTFTPHIYNILSRISKHSAVLMVTHFPALVESLATQNLKIEQGRIIR